MRTWLAVLASASLLGALIGTAVAQPAAAAGLSPPVADCYSHGVLTHSYSAVQLKHALATIPADVNEYSNCHDLIEHALLAKLGKLSGSGGSGGGGSFLPTWLIVVLALVVAGGGAFAVLAARNRRTAG